MSLTWGGIQENNAWLRITKPRETVEKVRKSLHFA